MCWYHNVGLSSNGASFSQPCVVHPRMCTRRYLSVASVAFALKEQRACACYMLQVSGGPVYVSDRPGKHNMELLKRMVLPDGNVLLCTQPGRPTLDCLFADCMRDRQTLLKVCYMLFDALSGSPLQWKDCP